MSGGQLALCIIVTPRPARLTRHIGTCRQLGPRRRRNGSSLLVHVLLVLAFPREIQLLMPTDIQGDEQAIVSPPVARLAVGTHAEQLSRHCNGTWCLLSSACDAVVDETMLT